MQMLSTDQYYEGYKLKTPQNQLPRKRFESEIVGEVCTAFVTRVSSVAERLISDLNTTAGD